MAEALMEWHGTFSHDIPLRDDGGKESLGEVQEWNAEKSAILRQLREVTSLAVRTFDAVATANARIAELEAKLAEKVEAEGEKTREEVRAVKRIGKDWARRVEAFKRFERALQNERGARVEIMQGSMDEMRAEGKPVAGVTAATLERQCRDWVKMGRPGAAAYAAAMEGKRRGHRAK